MANVVDYIQRATGDINVQRAMLMGSALEGGWTSPYPVGDHGTSLGPFQIHLPAHPEVTAAQANDPDFAVSYMLPAYESAVSRVGQINDAQSAALAAFYAERPAVMYPSKRYDAAWNGVLNPSVGGAVPIMSGTPGEGTPSPGGSSGMFDSFIAPFRSIGSAFDWMNKLFTALFLPKTWVRVLCFAIGTVLVIVGLFMFFVSGSTTAKMAERAAML